MFHSVVPSLDKVLPYYARSPREILHFTAHLPQHTNFCCLTTDVGFKTHKLLGYYSF